MLYEVITPNKRRQSVSRYFRPSAALWPGAAIPDPVYVSTVSVFEADQMDLFGVITSYSIHYTKLYDISKKIVNLYILFAIKLSNIKPNFSKC